jgi:hypothetical protein
MNTDSIEAMAVKASILVRIVEKKAPLFGRLELGPSECFEVLTAISNRVPVIRICFPNFIGWLGAAVVQAVSGWFGRVPHCVFFHVRVCKYKP